MKLLVGLGNPGKEYENTRHNVGFLFLDYLAHNSDENFPHTFNTQKKFHAEIAEIQLENERILLLKPLTFMNESGRAVSGALQFYKLSPSDLILVHDDLDIAFGQFKIQHAKGPKIHNGVTSVETSIQSSEFLRVRIGVENRTVPISGSEYVLQNFTQEELNELKKIFSHVSTSFNQFQPV